MNMKGYRMGPWMKFGAQLSAVVFVVHYNPCGLLYMVKSFHKMLHNCGWLCCFPVLLQCESSIKSVCFPVEKGELIV